MLEITYQLVGGATQAGGFVADLFGVAGEGGDGLVGVGAELAVAVWADNPAAGAVGADLGLCVILFQRGGEAIAGYVVKGVARPGFGYILDVRVLSVALDKVNIQDCYGVKFQPLRLVDGGEHYVALAVNALFKEVDGLAQRVEHSGYAAE